MTGQKHAISENIVEYKEKTDKMKARMLAAMEQDKLMTAEDKLTEKYRKFREEVLELAVEAVKLEEEGEILASSLG